MMLLVDPWSLKTREAFPQKPGPAMRAEPPKLVQQTAPAALQIDGRRRVEALGMGHGQCAVKASPAAVVSTTFTLMGLNRSISPSRPMSIAPLLPSFQYDGAAPAGKQPAADLLGVFDLAVFTPCVRSAPASSSASPWLE